MDDMNPYERVSITSTDDAAILKQARIPYLYKSTDTAPENNPSGEHPYLYIRVPDLKNEFAPNSISDYQLPKVEVVRFARSKMSSPVALPTNQ